MSVLQSDKGTLFITQPLEQGLVQLPGRLHLQAAGTVRPWDNPSQNRLTNIPVCSSSRSTHFSKNWSLNVLVPREESSSLVHFLGSDQNETPGNHTDTY